MKPKTIIQVSDGTTTVDLRQVVVPDGAISANGVVDLAAVFDTKADNPLFGYAPANQSITAGEISTAPITGLSVTVETGFYQAEVWILCDATSVSAGDISTGGTAVFESNLLAEIYTSNGSASGNARPQIFETSGGLAGSFAAEQLLVFTGTIKVTTAGTIILNGASVNAPDAFVIGANSTITLTKIGD